MATHHKSDAEIIATTHNMARFFTEHRQVGMVLLLATFVWGWFGYQNMPKRKDPNIPVRVASAQCQWPGATAEQVEQLVTRPIEQAVALNSTLKSTSPSDFGIRSISFPGLSVVYIQLRRQRKGQAEAVLRHEPETESAQPAARCRADPVQQQFWRHRGANADGRQSQGHADGSCPARHRHPEGHREDARANWRATRRNRASASSMRFRFRLPRAPCVRTFENIAGIAARNGTLDDLRFSRARATLDWMPALPCDDATIRERGEQLIRRQPAPLRDSPRRMAAGDHPRSRRYRSRGWREVAGAKYSYRDLDDFTDLIQRTLQGVPETSKVSRSGVLAEQIYLDYSQQRLAQYGYDPSKLKDVLGAQNITLPAGSLEVGPQDLTINPSGLFPMPRPSATSSSACPRPTARSICATWWTFRAPIRARRRYPELSDLAATTNGNWIRSRAITLGDLHARRASRSTCSAAPVARSWKASSSICPTTSIMVHTSDQPVQVKEQIDLFMDALYEAIGLVVIVSLIGFWEWRSALLMAISIPITLAMTFGMHLRARHRHPAGVGSLADHRARAAGGRPGGGRRLHQAHAGGRAAPHRRALAWARRRSPPPSCTRPSPTSSPICRSCWLQATPASSCSACRS